MKPRPPSIFRMAALAALAVYGCAMEALAGGSRANLPLDESEEFKDLMAMVALVFALVAWTFAVLTAALLLRKKKRLPAAVRSAGANRHHPYHNSPPSCHVDGRSSSSHGSWQLLRRPVDLFLMSGVWREDIRPSSARLKPNSSPSRQSWH